MPNSKKLSIIIINYRSQDPLKECLDSIFDKIPSGVDYETIVVNNDSQEKLKILKDAYSEAVFIDHKKNIGFGPAVNLAAWRAQGEYLFLLNPDAKISEGKIEKILDLFSSNNSLGVVGPKILEKSGEIQSWSAGKEVTLMKVLFNNLKFRKKWKKFRSQCPQEVDWVSGAAFFVPSYLFKSLGGFDEEFFMYFEDVDFCRRVRQQEKKVLFWPYLSVIHEGGRSLADGEKRKKYFYSSQDYYFKKHFGNFKFKTLKFLRRIAVGK